MTPADPSRTRKYVYVLLIVVAAAGIAGRIGSVSLVLEPELHTDKRTPKDQRRPWPPKRPSPMPTFSSNDRSRWATIRALVDGDPETGERGYAIGRRDRKTVLVSAVTPLAACNPLETAVLETAGYRARVAEASNRGIIFEDGYQSVDKVLHPRELRFYSSKPPLLSTLVAGLYWLLQLLTSWTLERDPFEVVRTILFLVNLLPMVVYLALLARLIERYGTTDWGRLYVFAAACFATLLTPFAIALNNHTTGTVCILFALYPALSIWRAPDGNASPWQFVLSGFFASFAVTNELPAAAFAAALFVLLLWRRPRRTLAFFVPAALIPLAGLAVTNYAALGQLRPAYSEFGGPWYEYEGSHWRKAAPGEVKSGIDWARNKESRATYAFHVLFGHHGLFSLSPIWLLAIAGMFGAVSHWRALRRPSSAADTTRPAEPRSDLVLVGGLTLVLTVVVVGFYLVKSDNYGGWTNGLRWLMWLTPLWLLTMVPIVDRMAERRWARWLAYALLAASVFAVSYRLWNPWRHPWIYDFMEAQGWITY